MTDTKILDTQRVIKLKQALTAADQSARFVVALELAKQGDPESIPALIEGFQTDNFITRLYQAAQSLTNLRDVAVPALTAALTAEHETVRVDAAYALWKIDPKRSQELLPIALDALRNWNPALPMEEQARGPVLDAAIFLGEMGTAANGAIPVLAELLRRRVRLEEPLAWHEDLRVGLAYLMTQITDSPSAVAAPLIEALQANDESLRWGAARVLGEVGQSAAAAIPALTNLLTNEHEFETIRVEAAYSLAVMGDPLRETLPAITQALKSADWWVRAFMTRLLGAMGATEEPVNAEQMFWLNRLFFPFHAVRRINDPGQLVVPHLLTALVDDDYNVRRNAAFALSLIGAKATDAIPALIATMRTPDVGPIAAEAIAKIGEAAIPALVTMLDEKDELLHNHAAYALQLIDTPEAHEALHQAKAKGIKPLQPAYHHFFLQCPVAFDDQKKAAFEALFAETIARGIGSAVIYTLPYPKHEFLRYLVEYKGLFMHGTEHLDIEVLHPRSQSTSDNETGRVYGIYADKDHLRPLYFAVINRRRCPSLNNGFFDLHEDGTPVTNEEEALLDRRYYRLAINITSLPRDPWRNGVVYALPPDTFEFWEEWTSRVPVQPILRLAVTPEDLPLKEDVWGDDERMCSYGWVDVGKDPFPFLKDVRSTPFHTVGQPPWLRQA